MLVLLFCLSCPTECWNRSLLVCFFFAVQGQRCYVSRGCHKTIGKLSVLVCGYAAFKGQCYSLWLGLKFHFGCSMMAALQWMNLFLASALGG